MISLGVDSNMTNNLFNEQVVPDYLTKETLEKYYREYYYYNLMKQKDNMYWMKLKDIPTVNIDAWYMVGDQYLRDSESDNLKLGRDIVQNGTYWPIATFKNDDGTVRLREGGHRIDSLRQLADIGEVSMDMELLVLQDDAKRRTCNKYYVPSPHIVSSEYHKKYEEVYLDIYKSMANGAYEFGDDGRLLLVDNANLFYISQAMFSHLLRNAFFEYREKTGEIIKPNPIFNNKELWYEEVKKDVKG